jgi:hypothetical protein
MNWRDRGTGLPVETIDGNVIAARGSIASVYRIQTVSFEFLSLAEKVKLYERLAWWILKAEANFSLGEPA